MPLSVISVARSAVLMLILPGVVGEVACVADVGVVAVVAKVEVVAEVADVADVPFDAEGSVKSTSVSISLLLILRPRYNPQRNAHKIRQIQPRMEMGVIFIWIFSCIDYALKS